MTYLAGPDNPTLNWISDPADKKAAEKWVCVGSSPLGEESFLIGVGSSILCASCWSSAGSWVGPYFSRRVMKLGNGRAYQVTLGRHTKQQLYWFVQLAMKP